MLRKLGHITAEGVVSMKGRAACEISTGDELLTTELMFNGVFNSLDKHQLVALISCLVPTEKSNVRPILIITGVYHCLPREMHWLNCPIATFVLTSQFMRLRNVYEDMDVLVSESAYARPYVKYDNLPPLSDSSSSMNLISSREFAWLEYWGLSC